MNLLRRRICACLLCLASFVTPLIGAASHIPTHPDHPGHIQGLT